jgi:response regulator RpfG family c-di-GMP phosphodiesterase
VLAVSHAGCRLCSLLKDSESDCEPDQIDLGQRALETNSPACGQSSSGCELLAVPVRQRRRAIGVAVVCRPPEALFDEEALARWCDEFELDRQTVQDAVDQLHHGPAGDTQCLLRVVEWLIGYEVSTHVAQDELTTLSTNLAATYEELSLLYRISSSMRVTREPGDFLQTVVDQLTDVMSVTGAVAWLKSQADDGRDSFVVSGCEGVEMDGLRKLMTTELADRLEKDNTPIVQNEPGQSGRDVPAWVDRYVAVPLVNGKKFLGMVLVVNKVQEEFDSADIKLVASINDQVAVFLTNNMLYAELQSLLMGVLYSLTEAIDAKDPYTCGHSRRVAMISRMLAKESGLSEEHCQRVYLCGLLHDIGKIGVPEAVLCKAGRLTDEEFDMIKRHPMIGAKILGGIRQLDSVVPGILTHHERLDGRGYPEGLTAENLPIEGRMVGLADAFDAMTSNRTYRKALELDQVVAEIRKHAGEQFDQSLVDILLAKDLEAYLEEIRHREPTFSPLSLLEESIT